MITAPSTFLTFDAEIEALQRHHIRLLAWWFPGELNSEAHLILDVLKRHGLRGVQLWVTGGAHAPSPVTGGPRAPSLVTGGAYAPSPVIGGTRAPSRVIGGPRAPSRVIIGAPADSSTAEQSSRVEAEAARIRPIAEEAARIGCTVALYNHGGWFGEPENQIFIIERLRAQAVTNVGIVYNQHHGHAHVERFPELLAKMKPYLVALNLNGMSREGEKKLILPLGQGDHDLQLLRVIRDSGWRGPVGLLNHTDEDAEARLQDNLDGLNWLVPQLEGKHAGAKPQPRSWRQESASPFRP